MKKTILSSALLLSVCCAANAAPSLITNSADAALAGSTTLDFNAEAQGTFTTQIFGGAVTISSAGSLYVENTYANQYGATGNYVTNQQTPNPVTLTFGSSVSAFGFNWGAADQPWTLDLFDTANNLIGTFGIPAQTDPFVGFIGANGGGLAIGSARLTSLSSYGYDYFLLDNLQYVTGNGSNGIPEPTTAALLGFGMAALGMARRRKA